MSSAAEDSLFPEAVKDFVFDLHDASRRSFVPSEQQSLYQTTFREITSKYFPNVAWPSPKAIASECGNDTLFLALYNELTLRHLQSVKRPTPRDRIEGWHAYRQLFDLILEEAPKEGEEKKPDSLYLTPEWCFDILHEFLYQFQGFCQFRTTSYTAAAKVADDPDKAPNAQTADALDALGQNRDAWAVETVLFYLHRLVAVGTKSKHASATYRYLAYFSSVTLSRLECLLGDYRASIAALDAIYDPAAELVAVGEDMKSPEELVNGVFPARLSLTYHAGVSYLMLRRYKDSASILGGICLFMQRGFKTGQLRKIPGSEQFNKLFDRMVALLAILSHICPISVVDDAIANVVRDKHGNNLSKIEAGEEGYEELFIFACPKFVNPAVPDYSQALKPGCPAIPYGQDAYKLQVQNFMNEMSTYASIRKMRSYMSLYTSIEVEKLASFNDMKVGEFEAWLTCFKHKMRQLERGTVVTSAESASKGVVKGVNSKQDKVGSAMDIHYFVTGNVVHVDEAEKARRFETFFMKQIQNNDDILRQAENIKIEMH
eukprot:CAMPEP_0172327414 /NCGR_PEP_ID=MMETSP1058-20130122/59502_1 /TAXON_ID=83371 /ORGANISM="Detonula confervacea, Strain CCMP 353" /LENGTH=544 /DNA_ID=CAMNT_0013044453 /DNA_START=41 /DNA_END=1675 /DNA_ORIENTATION=-